MRIGASFSLISSRYLTQTSRALSRALERLSTGKRLNSPRDDLASFATSVGLHSQLRGLAQANRNIAIGSGLLQATESALSSQMDILQRMRELAIQASNGTLSLLEREHLQKELQSLLEEFSSISRTAEFNSIKLLDPASNTLSLQTGAGRGDPFSLELFSSTANNSFQKTIFNGNFELTDSIGLPGNTRDVELGDFDGDGHLDALQALGGSGGVIVFLGDGEGGFTEFQHIQSALTINQVEVADINNDGILDFITADRTNSSISIFLGQGDGSFEFESNYSESGTIENVKLADFNGDGNLDVASYGHISGSSDLMSIRFGDGSGAFGAAQTYASQAAGTSGQGNIDVGDIDGDGDVDFILVAGSSISAMIVDIYLNDGNGNFSLASTFNVNLYATVPKLIDTDLDGDLDIVMHTRNPAAGQPGTIAIYENNNGLYSLLQSVTSGSYIIEDMEAADINADGYLDLVFNGPDLFYSLANGDGTYANPIILSSSNGDGVALGDLNGDGVIDILASNDDTNELSIYLAGRKTVTALSDFDLSSGEKAQKLLGILDGAITKQAERRAAVGIQYRVLEHRMQLNLVLSHSLEEARSRIEDADLSMEIAELARLQILQQAQVAVLSQQNLQMQLVLSLFENFRK